MSDAEALTLHASAVAAFGAGLLIRGRSGRGKSGLALQLMALGATLVADDRTEIRREGGTLNMGAPQAIRGLIEARGIGILRAEAIQGVPLKAVVDLDVAESERLPPARSTEILGLAVDVIRAGKDASFPSALMQYLKGGRMFGS